MKRVDLIKTILSFGLALPCAWLIICSAWGTAFAQEEEDEPFRPGLIGHYTDAQQTAIDRIDRAVSFTWHERSPDRRLAAGKFHVQWRGLLMSQANGAYQLHAYFAGQLRVTIDGTTVLTAEAQQPSWHSSQPLELHFDYHPIQVDYEKLFESAEVSLYWSGPQFQLEPIDGRQLFHDRKDTPSQAFERGQQLVRALRCSACHTLPGEPPAFPAPALDRLAGNMHHHWMVDWLTKTPSPVAAQNPDELARRMPHFAISAEEAHALAAYLLAKSAPPAEELRRPQSQNVPPNRKAVVDKDEKSKKKKKTKDNEPQTPPKTPVESGRELVLTVGCLACHRLGDLGQGNLFGGGDLSLVAEKRPANFFARWLLAPATINSDHRMPVFELTGQEQQHIARFLATLGQPRLSPDATTKAAASADQIGRGERLYAEYRCGACHKGPPGSSTNSNVLKSVLSANSHWERACTGSTGAPRQPQFALSDADRNALREFATSSNPLASARGVAESILQEHNCLACHARNDAPGLAPRLTQVAQQHAELASLVPAMTPPPLISVGDKLHDTALRDAIRRQGPPHRPYLLVRMPMFALKDAELQVLVDDLIAADRIPPSAPSSTIRSLASDERKVLLDALGTRLVTPDGFGCTSCHQVGNVLPAKAPLNARGPDLSLLGRRIRREWFDRFVRNPSRIVPRMEMPSVQVAVRGVLGDHLDAQVAAVWEVLNRPGFEPPEPNPVRIVRHSGTDLNRRAYVITDVVRTKSAVFVKPLLVGLSNRHNILLDLETARLAAWSIGDVARQHTEGKTWFWEAAGRDLLANRSTESEFSLWLDGRRQQPSLVGQFPTEFDVLQHVENSLRVRYRLQFADQQIYVTQTFTPLSTAGLTLFSGFRRVVEVSGAVPGTELYLRVADGRKDQPLSIAGDGKTLQIGPTGQGSSSVRLVEPPTGRFETEGLLRVSAGSAQPVVRWEMEYLTDLSIDQFTLKSPEPPPLQAAPLQVVPGFTSVRLPLSDEIMPTGLAWQPNGTLVIASLKGQVWLAHDHDADGLADRLTPFSDDLPAPYGLYATDEYVDVITKFALLRLFDDDRDGRADRTVTVASGWGHTADYHDWVVGLPRDQEGNYFVGLPCQQDERSAAAAYLRGEFLRLVSRRPTAEDPRLFSIERISRGHRFPMGIARSRDGELFVTDNQGNYNPFNELNHVRQGAHFGFINSIDKGRGPPITVTPPAIDIPHPWTRSVNGICFLDTPQSARRRLGRDAFGPWEGQLVGCEYDTRRLVRMTLEKIGETYQGAVYPFSYDEPKSGPPLLGPVVCDVSPDGDLYVGGLRDSGWGGSNNIGEVVRLRLEPANVGNGISEMRATPRSFTIDFVSPIDLRQAADVGNYALASYTRESTPAYGGPDLNRRTEKIKKAKVSDDGRRVKLELSELRAGYVYELHVKNLVPSAQPFFPAEAHYTMRVVPK